MGINPQQQTISNYQNITGTSSSSSSSTTTATNFQVTGGNGGLNLTNSNITNISNMSNNNNQTINQHNNTISHCCLIENGSRCVRNAGNASYSKRIEKQVAQRKLNLSVDPSSAHFYICEHHKQIIQSIRTSVKRISSGSSVATKRSKDEMESGSFLMDTDVDSVNDFNNGPLNTDSPNEQILSYHSHYHSPSPSIISSNMPLSSSSSNKTYGNYQSPCIDFHSLQVSTLRKYKRFYKIAVKNAANKNYLTDEIARHFHNNIQVNEKDTINKFIYTLKNGKNE